MFTTRTSLAPVSSVFDFDYGRNDILANDPVVAARPDGGWAVVFGLDSQWAGWEVGEIEELYGIALQLFDENGAPQGPLIRVEGDQALWPGLPEIEFHDDGGFTVIWASRDTVGEAPRLFPGDTITGYFAQDFAADGEKVGEVYAFEPAPEPAVWDGLETATLTDGTVVATSVADGVVNATLYHPDGTQIGAPIVVTGSNAVNWVPIPVIALPDGGFAVAWTDQGDEVDDPRNVKQDVYLRSFAADGTPDGEAVRVHEGSEEDQDSPSLAVLSSGELVVAWYDTDNDGEVSGFFGPVVKARLFSPDGEPLGDAVVLDDTGLVSLGDVSMAGQSDGSLAFVMEVFLRSSTSDGTLADLDHLSFQQFETSSALYGTDGADDFAGTAGDDRVFGLGGNDILRGEDGDDHLSGGAGFNKLHGGAGDDTITGGDLRDEVTGGIGADHIRGEDGNDLIYGQDGNDRISGGFGVDELFGQNGDDVIAGGAFSDLVFGGAGDDFVNGGFGFDRINGGDGADRFFHAGAAGHGSDWIQDYTAADGDVLVFGGTGATASDFVVRFAHTATPEGERSGDDDVQEAFVNFRGETLWALVDGGGEAQINLQIGGTVFDLLA